MLFLLRTLHKCFISDRSRQLFNFVYLSKLISERNRKRRVLPHQERTQSRFADVDEVFRTDRVGNE